MTNFTQKNENRKKYFGRDRDRNRAGAHAARRKRRNLNGTFGDVRNNALRAELEYGTMRSGTTDPHEKAKEGNSSAQQVLEDMDLL